MSQTTKETVERIEADLLAYCYIDATNIDKAVAGGISAGHFTSPVRFHQWKLLCELRLTGAATDTSAVYQAAVSRGVLEACGGVQGIMWAGDLSNASAGGCGPAISAVLVLHSKRESYKLLNHALEQLKDGGGDLSAIKDVAEKVAGICSGERSVQRDLPAIVGEAIKDAEEQIKGEASSRTLVTTGLPMFDKYATPIGPEELVIVAGRTSAGKSSLLLQIAGHNLARGLKVAIFSLETSDTVVIKQLVGQRARVNVRGIANEMPAKQQEYLEKLRFAKTSKNLIVFDRDINLKSIQARCGLLASSFKPDLVCIDYLNIIGHDGDSYEKTSRISNAMIEIRKQLGCATLVGAQLNRSSEKEDRPPGRTDLRDSGSVEQDCSRLLAIWRKPGQPLDSDWYDCELLQLKHRSGPLAKVDVRFHAPHTVFVESPRV